MRHEGTKARRHEGADGGVPAVRATSYDLERLRASLRPFRLHWFPRLRSTNDHAAELRRRGTLFAPAVVLAGQQTAGRGRGARAWWSRPGCLTATFVVASDDTVLPHQLPLLAGMAVRNAAVELTREDSIQLKWPNDLLFYGRKLAGLLCERVQGADLVGLGLNVNLDPAEAPEPLRGEVTSLSAIADRPLDLTDALLAVAAHLHRMLETAADRPFALLLREYDEHHALVGRNVSVVDGPDGAGISGKCEGLDEMGRLVVRSRSGVHHVISGHVRAI